MKRLTKKFDGVYITNCDNCSKHGNCYDSTDCVDVLVDRLAAYEDTGLEPEEINGLCEMDRRAKMADMLRQEDSFGVSIDRLRELAQAEKEGRCVVLACKVGDMVYTIKKDYFNCESCPHGEEAKYDPVFRNKSCDFPDGRDCPYIVRQNRCEGFNVSEKGVGRPGEWGCEGLEEFYSDGNFGLYYSREDAEAALAGKGKNESSNI